MGHFAIQFVCLLDPLTFLLHPSLFAKRLTFMDFLNGLPCPEASSSFQSMGVTSKREKNGKRVRVDTYSLLSLPWVIMGWDFLYPSAGNYSSYQVTTNLSWPLPSLTPLTLGYSNPRVPSYLCWFLSSMPTPL